jgi:hypothetical protein
MVLQPVRVRAAAAEAELKHDHPREAQLLAQPLDGRRDRAEVLRDERECAERVLDGAKELDAGTATPASRLRRFGALRYRPIRHEAAEVIDTHRVDELERAAEAFDPPAVAFGAHGAPVVERIRPQLAGRAERVGRRAGDRAALEELGARAVVRAALRDVDGEIAEDADAALTRICTQRFPLALEPHLIRDIPRKRCPVADPVRMTRDERLQLVRGDARVRLREKAVPRRERRRRLVRRAVLVRRAERENLPPRLPRRCEPVDEAVRVGVQPSARKRRRVQQNTG